jgi:hypothetical protein
LFLEKSWLLHFHFNALDGLVVVAFVGLKAYEVAMLHQRGYGCCARADGGI